MSNYTKISSLIKDLNIISKLQNITKNGRVKTLGSSTTTSPKILSPSKTPTSTTSVHQSKQQNVKGYRRSTAPTALPISKIITTKLFPLSTIESFQDYLKRADLDIAQENLLNLLKCYKDPQMITKTLKIKIDDEGNYINEFMIHSKNVDYSNCNHFVIIHGYGAGLGFYLKNLDEISSKDSNWCIHALDLPGYGCSSRPKYNESKSLEEYFVDTLEKWRINRGINKMLMCCHSLGAYMTLLYTMKYKHHVQKLLLISPAGIYRPKDLNLDIPPWFHYLWEQNISPFALVRNTGPFGSMITSGWTSRRFAKLTEIEQFYLHKYTYSIFNAQGSGEYYMSQVLGAGGVPKLPLLEKIEKISCDTTWCYGDEDWMPKEGGLKCIDKIIKNTNYSSDFKTFKNSGHHIYLDNYKDFNQFILDEMKNYEKKYIYM
ncbi:hypothetical protein BN7_5657 [Wickerhamomyces ciferrii]|uniref:AB hydrolase-1 domain-containing protein n=1 Tax=Wickerhamomyces ciferrii (strain ATCC 14091 / BCRC 22168 / CBS 111 / JCM 3599 / NBRC 0793 / NRRL Y-1031 F-60-10) TaxID=1206466 RepID=K0KX58_WICCF|nr:uncharacterized protein BN7_5657 [Wickerhamomyces ciferrii]CCH46069.1 hypothetical protein BN7_5657 [Wickerhamomyces ciferrii]